MEENKAPEVVETATDAGATATPAPTEGAVTVTADPTAAAPEVVSPEATPAPAADPSPEVPPAAGPAEPVNDGELGARFESLQQQITQQAEQLNAMRAAARQQALSHLGVKEAYREFAPDVDVTTPEGKAQLERWVTDRPEIVAKRDAPPEQHGVHTPAIAKQADRRSWLAKALRLQGKKYDEDTERIRRVHG